MTPADVLKQIEEDEYNLRHTIELFWEYAPKTESHQADLDALARLVAWAKKGAE